MASSPTRAATWPYASASSSTPSSTVPARVASTSCPRIVGPGVPGGKRSREHILAMTGCVRYVWMSPQLAQGCPGRAKAKRRQVCGLVVEPMEHLGALEEHRQSDG